MAFGVGWTSCSGITGWLLTTCTSSTSLHRSPFVCRRAAPTHRGSVNVTSAVQGPPSALVLMNLKELWHLLQQVSLDAVAMAVLPSLWHPPQQGRKAAAAAAAVVAAAKDAWAALGWRMGRVCSSMMAQ